MQSAACLCLAAAVESGQEGHVVSLVTGANEEVWTAIQQGLSDSTVRQGSVSREQQLQVWDLKLDHYCC
jgi:ABC-type sugar transport system substrate-binding protein